MLLVFNFSFGPMRNVGIPIPEGWLNARKALGMTGFLLVLIHALMSFMLFTPDVYGKFFEQDGSLTLLAGLSMLGGILAFVTLWAYNLSFQTHMREDKVFIGGNPWQQPYQAQPYQPQHYQAQPYQPVQSHQLYTAQPNYVNNDANSYGNNYGNHYAMQGYSQY